MLPFLIVSIGIAGCNSSSNQSDKEIDYATLDSLQTEVVLEIGESDDYLPGQLRDLKRTPSGGFLVADWASSTIEQFDEDGNHLATIATGGKGPGELGNYFMFRNTGNDTLLVSQIVSAQRDYFVPGGNGIYQFVSSEKQANRPERSFSIIGLQSDTSYYATVGSIFRFNEENESDYKSSALVVVNSRGEILEDSVQMYKTANPYVQRGGTSESVNISVHQIPYRFEDGVSILDNGSYLIARIDSNTIFQYGPNHALEKKIPLNVKTRPVTSSDIDIKLDDDLDSKTRNTIKSKVGDQKPAFLSVYATNKHIFLHTETDETGKEFVVIDNEGQALGKFMLPEDDSIQDIEGNKIYAIHRSSTKGDLIRVYKVEL